MLAVVYARVSTEDQARHGYSLDDQVARCEARAREMGVDEVRVFTDPGVSAAILDRPGLSAARELVRAGRVSFFVCYDPDRLARNLSHQLLLTEEIERHGARLEFINFEWKDTPEGKLFYSLRGAIAEYEKEKIRERTGRGRLAKARKGGLPHYYRVYGYSFDKQTDSLEIDPEEARVVRHIFRWFTSEPGLSFTGIAGRLEDMGCRPARNAAGRWDRTTIKGILRNEVYLGRAYVNRWDAAGAAYNRHLPPGERRGYQERPREEWIHIPVPPIVDETTWQAAQRRLEHMGRLRGGHRSADFLLSRIIWCGCGEGMSGKLQVPNGRTRYRYYTCNASRRGQPCGARQVNADRIEDLIWGRVKAWLTDPEAFREEVRRILPDDVRAGMEQEMSRIEAEIVKAHQGRDDLLYLVQRGAVRPIEVERLLEENLRTVERLKERRRELGEQLARHDLRAGDAERLARLTGEIATGIDDLGWEERRHLIRMMVEKVTVYADGRVAVTARINGPTPGGGPEDGGDLVRKSTQNGAISGGGAGAGAAEGVPPGGVGPGPDRAGGFGRHHPHEPEPPPPGD